jgi:DNA-binding NtrC family response regulator
MAKLRILLIDDEVDFLVLMQTRISSWGYEFIQAKDGRSGLAQFKQERPDVVVLDYKMPDMHGLDVLKEIRQLDKAVPVVMFTAYPEIKLIQEAEALQVCAFVPKISVYQDANSSLRSVLAMIEKKQVSPKEETKSHA